MFARERSRGRPSHSGRSPALLLVLLLGLGLGTGCRPDAPRTLTPNEATQEEQEQPEAAGFFDSHTRIVWTRTLPGASRDVYLRGDQHSLIVFDSDEGTERVLLPGPGSYQRPLLSPDGSVVVYTDVRKGSIHAVAFNGKEEPRLLLDGGLAALDLYTSPKGQTMVLAGAGLRDVEGLDVADELLRFDLENPSSTQAVAWAETTVDLNGFQSARDGTTFTAGLPWPDIGIADLSTGTWKKAGQGCWPSLAQDDSGLLWIFEGTHQQVSVISPQGKRKWPLRLDSHPELRGHEVYHPRWTSDPRLVVLSGPYVHDNATGHGKVGVGGQEVEIWVGRFSAALDEVETWLKLTSNSVGDFMPDLWIDGETKPLDLDLVHQGKPAGALVDDLASADWRMPEAGLAYVWETRETRNEVNLSEERNAIASEFELHGAARFGPQLQFELRGGEARDKGAGVAALASAIAEAEALTIELVLQTFERSERPARIIRIENPAGEMQFELGMSGHQLYLTLAGFPSASNPAQPLSLGSISGHRPHHLVLALGGGRIRYYLDGILAARAEGIVGTFQKWQGGRLILGRDWSGRASHLAFYAAELDENFIYAKHSMVEPLIAEWVPKGRVRVSARLRTPAPRPAPEDLGPYRRALIVQEFEKTDSPANASVNWPHERFLVASWALLDRREVIHGPRRQGAETTLTLEPFENHPELNGEWTAPYEAGVLPLFFDVGSPRLP